MCPAPRNGACILIVFQAFFEHGIFFYVPRRRNMQVQRPLMKISFVYFVNNLKENKCQECELNDSREMLFLLLGAVIALAVCRIIFLFVKYDVIHPIRAHDYPLRKDENFKIIKASAGKGTLPKAFRPNSFPLSSWRKGFHKLCKP